MITETPQETRCPGLLGGPVLTIAGFVYRSGMLLGVGLVALLAAGFVLADIATAYVVTTP